MRQLTESVYLHQDTCSVYILRSGRQAVLIDFGDGTVLDRLSAIGVDQVTDVLMTHHHRDQGQGLALAAAHGARIWVPETEQDLFGSVDRHWLARELTNNYNNRQDKFSLLEPIPVAGLLRDYATFQTGGLALQVIPTPGHTTGSITLLTELDGRRLAFTGDLLCGPGQIWSLAATQWTYNGGEGIPGSILSLLDLKERQPDLLLPSHGEPMTDPATAIDLTVERLTQLRDLRRQNPRLFDLRERPYAAITPHLLQNRTSMSNAYVLLSESGKALLIDFGYDFMFGPAAGADRASRRPWLYTLPALKRDFGVTAIDVVLPTHYHDDHVAGLNLLRAAEGAEVWAPDLFADVLERPTHYDLPCLWYDPIPVDRKLPLGQPIQWEEYELTLYPLSGHTYYAVAIAFEVDGHRVVAAGDQQGDGDGLMLNYVYKNGFRPYDYQDSAELYQRLQPDVIITGHWAPHWVQPGYFEKLLERGNELERLHRELLPQEAGISAAIHPYQAEVEAHRPFTLEVAVDGGEGAVVTLVLPDGWTAEPLSTNRFTVTPGAPVYRARVAADLTLGSRRLGQVAEALITVKEMSR